MDTYTDGEYLYVRMDGNYLYQVVPIRVSNIPDIFETLMWEEFDFILDNSIREKIVNYIIKTVDIFDMMRSIGVVLDSSNQPVIIDTKLGKYILMVVGLVPIDNIVYNIKSIDIIDYIERRDIEGD